MTITTAIILGAFGGVFTTVGVVTWLHSKQPEDTTAVVLGAQITELRSAIEGQTKIQTNLTAPDLLTVACSAEYMSNNGPLLCREMFCRLQHNGGGAAQSECEQIANVANSVAVFTVCNADTIDYDKCIDFVTRRK